MDLNPERGLGKMSLNVDFHQTEFGVGFPRLDRVRRLLPNLPQFQHLSDRPTAPEPEYLRNNSCCFQQSVEVSYG